MENLSKFLKSTLKEAQISTDELESNPKLNKLIQLLNDKLTYHKNSSLDQLEMFNILIESTPCTISWINSDLEYISVNSMLANSCGLDAKDFIGKKIGFYTENKNLYNFVQELFNQQHSNTLYKEFHLKVEEKEETKYFWLAANKFKNNNYALLIGLDITQLKNLEEFVVFREKVSSLGEMLVGILHEINNPLSAITMASSMIEKKYDQENKVLELNNIIKKMTDTISQIIKGIKSFVQHDEKTPKKNEVLRDIIQEAQFICQNKLKKGSINFEIIEETNNLPLTCNKTQILQVLVNLINNSIDAICNKDEKWIKITFEKKVSWIEIKFIDSGDGIRHEDVNNIFDSFFTTKIESGGTGMGLYICKKIINEHNGEIEIDSNHKNTCFIIKFNI